MRTLLLRLRWLLPIWLLLVLATFSSRSTFAYDYGNEPNRAYNSGSRSANGYDAFLEHPTNKTRNGRTWSLVLFANFAELVAAKGGTQPRDVFGKFTSKTPGQKAPGLNSVDDFVDQAQKNGF